jgi:hypothetical protein
MLCLQSGVQFSNTPVHSKPGELFKSILSPSRAGIIIIKTITRMFMVGERKNTVSQPVKTTCYILRVLHFSSHYITDQIGNSSATDVPCSVLDRICRVPFRNVPVIHRK